MPWNLSTAARTLQNVLDLVSRLPSENLAGEVARMLSEARSAPAAKATGNSVVSSAFVAGVLVGATAGLLFAPASGAELRRQLRERLEDRLRALRDRLGEGPSPEHRAATEPRPEAQAAAAPASGPDVRVVR